MKFKDIHFGSIDAKHDIEGRTPEEVKYFEDTFIVPPNIDEEDYQLPFKLMILPALIKEKKLIGYGFNDITKHLNLG